MASNRFHQQYELQKSRFDYTVYSLIGGRDSYPLAGETVQASQR